MFKCNLFMFVDLKKKINAKEKLPVEKGPQMFDCMSCLGLGMRQRWWTVLCFWYFFKIYF